MGWLPVAVADRLAGCGMRSSFLRRGATSAAQRGGGSESGGREGPCLGATRWGGGSLFGDGGSKDGCGES